MSQRHNKLTDELIRTLENLDSPVPALCKYIERAADRVLVAENNILMWPPLQRELSFLEERTVQSAACVILNMNSNHA